jgi:hypothetical protein
MDHKEDTSPEDVNEDALQDMTVNGSGDMQDAPAEVPENEITAPASVMDVTPPPQDDVVSAPAEVHEEASVSSDVVNEPTPEAISDAPAEEQVILPTGADPAMPVVEAKKGAGKGLVVAISVILALLLAAVAVLVFMKTSNSAKKSTTKDSAAATSTTQPKATVTATDLDTASKTVDDTLGTLNDTTDFNPDALTDKALGLQ